MNFRLTEGILQREVHEVARHMGMVDHVKIGKDVKTSFEKCKSEEGFFLKIAIGDLRCCIHLFDEDLQLCLDDFSERIILPSMKSLQYGFKDAHIPAFS